ncbi:MAG: UDP-3-O-acyl-N-acetylglucosamine deacetylase [Armatimonadia bacterium]
MTHRRGTLDHAVALPPAVGTLCLRPVTVRLLPADVGAGLRLKREDTGQEWPVGLEYLVPATNCTAFGDETGQVAFMEHLLACLWAAEITDAVISTDGPEIPLYDGSGRGLWAAVGEAGRKGSAEAIEAIEVTEPVWLVEEGQALIGLPLEQSGSETPPTGSSSTGSSSVFTYVLEHPHPVIGRQWAEFEAGDDFGAEVAPARTWATAEQIRSTRGMEPGPDVEALCLIVYDDRMSEEPTLPQALARHKLLDLLGDLYVCGRPVEGRIVALKTGHGDNHEFLRRLAEGA